MAPPRGHSPSRYDRIGVPGHHRFAARAGRERRGATRSLQQGPPARSAGLHTRRNGCSIGRRDRSRGERTEGRDATRGRAGRQARIGGANSVTTGGRARGPGGQNRYAAASTSPRPQRGSSDGTITPDPARRGRRGDDRSASARSGTSRTTAAPLSRRAAELATRSSVTAWTGRRPPRVEGQERRAPPRAAGTPTREQLARLNASLGVGDGGDTRNVSVVAEAPQRSVRTRYSLDLVWALKPGARRRSHPERPAREAHASAGRPYPAASAASSEFGSRMASRGRAATRRPQPPPPLRGNRRARRPALMLSNEDPGPPPHAVHGQPPALRAAPARHNGVPGQLGSGCDVHRGPTVRRPPHWPHGGQREEHDTRRGTAQRRQRAQQHTSFSSDEASARDPSASRRVAGRSSPLYQW